MSDVDINALANEAMQSIETDDEEDYAHARSAIEIVIAKAVKLEREACAKAVSDTEVVRIGSGYMQCDDGQGSLNAAERAILARGDS